MSRFRIYPWSLALLLVGLGFQISVASALQEDAEASDDQLDAGQQLLVNEIRDEIEKICSVEIGMLIERYAEFFELDEEARQRLDDAGKEIVEEHVEKFTDAKILESWRQIGQANGAENSGFVINGRECFLEDSEDEDRPDPDQLPKISMCLFKTTMLFMVAYDSGTTTTYMQYQNKFKPTEAKQWKDALPNLTDKDLERFAEHRNEVKRDKAVSLVLSTLEIQLKLTEEQLEPTREWILESMGDDNLSQKEIYGVAKLAYQRLIDPPDFLSEEQKKVLAGIRAMHER